jgi:signal transduction histidine kinase
VKPLENASRLFHDFGIAAAIAVAYVVAGRMGLALAVVHPSATAVWAPTGIALAALLILGPRFWPAIFIGAFAVNMITGSSIAVSLGIASGNTLEGLAGAALVRRFAGGKNAFERAGNIFRYSVFVAIATTISATIGVLSLAAAGSVPGRDFLPVAMTWWLGDLSGALVVAPVLILWSTHRKLSWTGAQRREAAAIVISILVIGVLLFGGESSIAVRHLPLQFLCVPVLLWPAFRFGLRETATACLLLSAMAAWGTALGLGPFAWLSPRESLPMLQGFMDVTSVTTLVVAVLVAERAEAARVRDEFLSIAGHELRTPLSALVLQIESLSRGIGDGAPVEKLRERLLPIRRSTQRLTALIDEVLNVNRITSGSLSVRLLPVELSGFIRDATRRFFEHLDVSPETAELRAPEPVWCWSDPERLEYVFNNLLSNAVKYGLGKPVEIIVGRSNGFATVSVRDHGEGISLEDQKRIFERFERAAARNGVSGFGLGLWIARQTAEALGGKIRLESRPGEGSTFSVDLPLEEVRTSS